MSLTVEIDSVCAVNSDIVLHLYKLLFPKFNSALLRNNEEGEMWIDLPHALAAVHTVFPDSPLAFSIDRLHLSKSRKHRMLEHVKVLGNTVYHPPHKR